MVDWRKKLDWSEPEGRRLVMTAGAILALILVGGVVLGTEISSRRKCLARFHKARDSYWQRDYDQAITEFQDLRLSYPGKRWAAEALYYIGDCRYQQGDFDKALEHYRDYLKQAPDGRLAPEAWAGMGHAHEGKGQLEAALEAYEEITRRWPDHYFTPEAHLTTARYYERLGKVGKARQEYKMVIETYADSPAAMEAEERLAFLPPEPEGDESQEGNFPFGSPGNKETATEKAASEPETEAPPGISSQGVEKEPAALLADSPGKGQGKSEK